MNDIRHYTKQELSLQFENVETHYLAMLEIKEKGTFNDLMQYTQTHFKFTFEQLENLKETFDNIEP